MLNSVTLVGRLGADPEIKYFDSGKAKARLRVATDRPSKEKQTDWHNVEIWGKAAETAAEHLRKGAVIGIEGGRIEYQSYESQGEKKYMTIITANGFRFIGGKKDEGGGNGGGGRASAEFDDDVPF